MNNTPLWQFLLNLLLRPRATYRRLKNERHNLQSQLQSSEANEAFLNNLIQSIPDLIWLKDPAGKYLACNPAFERFFGAAQADIIGKTDFDFVEAELASSFRRHDQAALDAGHALVNEEWITFASDGKHTLVETTKVPMLTASGALIGVLGIARDITERKRLEAELLEMATTDFLTGISNRRHFIARMEEELARVHRLDTLDVAVLLLDIDHFKHINDRHGHASGDAVLKQFAEMIRAELRIVDSVGRVGGEEFAILLAGTDAVGGQIFAERLRRRVENTAVQLNEQQIALTVSIGVAAMSALDTTSNDVLHRADTALYAAKEQGRNRVQMAANMRS